MRKGMRSKREEEEKREKEKKKQTSVIERELFLFLHKSLKVAVDKAVDDLLKDWK